MSVTLNELHDAMEACGWLDCVPEGCEWIVGGGDWFLKYEPMEIRLPDKVAIAAICKCVAERAAKLCSRRAVYSGPNWIIENWNGCRWINACLGGVGFISLESSVLALLRAMEKKKPTQSRGEALAKRYYDSPSHRLGVALLSQMIDAELTACGIDTELAAKEAGR